MVNICVISPIFSLRTTRFSKLCVCNGSLRVWIFLYWNGPHFGNSSLGSLLGNYLTTFRGVWDHTSTHVYCVSLVDTLLVFQDPSTVGVLGVSIDRSRRGDISVWEWHSCLPIRMSLTRHIFVTTFDLSSELMILLVSTPLRPDNWTLRLQKLWSSSAISSLGISVRRSFWWNRKEVSLEEDFLIPPFFL